MVQREGLFFLIQACLNMGVYMFFVIAPFRNRFRYSFKKTIFILSLFLVFFIPVIVLCYTEISPLAQFRLPATVISLALAFILFRMSVKGSSLELIFSIFIIFNIHFNVVVLARILYSAEFIPAFFKAGYSGYILISIMVLLLSIPVLWCFFMNLFKKVIDLNLEFSYWQYLLGLPIIYFILVMFFLSGNKADAFAYSLDDIMSFMLIGICSFLTYIIVLLNLIKMSENLEHIKKMNETEKLLVIQKCQYEETMESIEKTSRLYHDWRQHLLCIVEYSKQGNLEILNEYLNSCLSEYPLENLSLICEKRIVDILLRHYRSEAQFKGITINFKVEVPREFPMEDTELSIVFGNLLENAVEACERQKDGEKFINVKVKSISDNILALSIENSFNGIVREKEGAFYSQKRDRMGIGTASIKNIVEKSGGTCEFSYTDKTFLARVLLNA